MQISFIVLDKATGIAISKISVVMVFRMFTE